MSPPSYVHPSAECEPGATLGEGTRIWRFTHVMAGAQIGRHVSIGQGCFVAPSVVVGDYTRIQNGVSIFDGVTLEAYVFCGPGVVFTNVVTPRVEYPAVGTYLLTRVMCGASLGANSTILAGVTVGCYALVGAGSVVTRDVPDFALVMGNPGRVRGWVSKRGDRLVFDERRRARCPGGDVYELDSTTDAVRLVTE